MEMEIDVDDKVDGRRPHADQLDLLRVAVSRIEVAARAVVHECVVSATADKHLL